MKRFVLVFPLLTFWLWALTPAGANTVPEIALSCDAVSVSWARFPARNVDLHIQVNDNPATTIGTEGAPDGHVSLPVTLHSGTATASVSWVLRKPHSVSTSAVLECTPVPTSTTLVSSTTGPSETSSSGPSTSVGGVECGPSTLPCTGPRGDTDAMLLGGFVAVVAGSGLLAVSRKRKAR